MKIKKRLEELLKELNQDVFEKEEITRLALLSAVAGESIFLLGAPGVAKSLVSPPSVFRFHLRRRLVSDKRRSPLAHKGSITISRYSAKALY
jgi:MoxR-like ATPase